MFDGKTNSGANPWKLFQWEQLMSYYLRKSLHTLCIVFAHVFASPCGHDDVFWKTYWLMCVRLTSTGLGTTTSGTKWHPASITSWAVSAGSNTMERCPSKISTVTPASVKSLLSRWGSTGLVLFESLFVLNIMMMEADLFFFFFSFEGGRKCFSHSSTIQKSLVTHCSRGCLVF